MANDRTPSGAKDGRGAPTGGRGPAKDRVVPAKDRVAPAKDRVAPAKGRVAPAKGRVTPPKDRRTASPNARYTPPVPKEFKESKKWVPVMMAVLLLGGAALIVCNYLDVLPGGANNGYLLVGLVLITVGFVAATQWR